MGNNYYKDNTSVNQDSLRIKRLDNAINEYKKIQKLKSNSKLEGISDEDARKIFQASINKPKISEVNPDNRTEKQRKIDTKYYEDVTNPSLKQQVVEATQLPLRYLANPLKITGDLAQTIAPKSALAKDLPNTSNDRYEYRKSQLKPNQSISTSITRSLNESAPLVRDAALNLGLPETTVGKTGQAMKEVYKDYKTLKTLPRQTKLGAAKMTYYRNAPWTWKPSPSSYYRTGKGEEFLNDVINTGKIRAISEQAPKTTSMLLRKKFPESDTYWSKGVPLDKKYGTQNYGTHVIEQSTNTPFIHAVNQRTRQLGFAENPDFDFNLTHKIEQYVKPRQSYGYNAKGEIEMSLGTPLDYTRNTKLLKPHWFYGYKEYKPKLK